MQLRIVAEQGSGTGRNGDSLKVLADVPQMLVCVSKERKRKVETADGLQL